MANAARGAGGITERPLTNGMQRFTKHLANRMDMQNAFNILEKTIYPKQFYNLFSPILIIGLCMSNMPR
jgi:hypothetical protein